MPTTCPRCQKSVSANAIACPHCQTPLKALGHQGIPLHQASSGTVLCDTCTYHKDDSCNYPQRPVAKDCIMYVDDRIRLNPPPPAPTSSWISGFKRWANQNLALLLLIALILVSLWMVLSGR